MENLSAELGRRSDRLTWRGEQGKEKGRLQSLCVVPFLRAVHGSSVDRPGPIGESAFTGAFFTSDDGAAAAIDVARCCRSPVHPASLHYGTAALPRVHWPDAINYVQ